MELYVHIPFCAKKCEYCSFVSFPAPDPQKDAYIGAVLREAEQRRTEINEPVTTAYIGGGTPSLLSPSQLIRLVSGLRGIFPMDECVEFTIEANPGTVTEPFMEAVSFLRINRLSLGMQAFQPRLLKTLGRIHSFEEVKKTVRMAEQYGLGNLNLDLIFGIPGQTAEEWDETLEAALSLHPEHISAYGLIPEEGTPLWERLVRKEYSLPDPDLERDMYDHAIRRLEENGLFQYEISNFARKGYECRHNIGYWTQEPYIGLGISAASMRIAGKGKGGMVCLRRTNTETMDRYLSMTGKDGAAVPEEETVMPRDARFETMMLSLRMNGGITPERFHELHGVSLESCFGGPLTKMESAGLMCFRDGAWCLTRKGMDVQNSVLLEFMDGP